MVVVVLKYLINTGEEVDVKDGLEGGSNKREHESIYEKDVNSMVGLREMIKLVYRYPAARLKLQNLFLSNLLCIEVR